MNDLADAYEECRLITRKEAKNFYYAFITLPPQKRRAIYAAYAFCRICDDAVDGDYPDDIKFEILRKVRSDLSGCYEGRSNGPVYTALADAASTYDIPEDYFQQVISGVEMDLTRSCYQDFEELRTYCYGVACAVGLICVQVFGYSNNKARGYAVDLGLAMQLTNIMRDVKEDLERGRVYIPMDEIDRFGYSLAGLESGEINGPYLDLMHFQAQRARSFFESGFKLLPLLSPRSRGCPAVLGQIYSRLLDRIETKGFNVFDERVSLSKREKYIVTARTWMKSLFLPV